MPPSKSLSMPGQQRPKVSHAQPLSVSDLAAFCKTLQRRLPSSLDSPAIDPLLVDLKEHIRRILVSTTRGNLGSRQGCDDLNRCGTELWNLCTRLRRQDAPGAPPTRSRLLLRSRFFAFLLIDLVRWKPAGTPGTEVADVVHLMKLALKTGKSCIDEGNSEDALAGLQKAADYNSRLLDLRDDLDGPGIAEQKRLEAEYFTLRTALSWKDNRLDVAEHMYGKAEALRQALDPHSAANLADILFEIGKDLSEKKDYAMSVKWLERSYEVINGQELELLSRDAVELRLSICRALVHALLSTNLQDNSAKALNLVNYMESEIGDKPIVLLLRLELLQHAPAEVFDSNAYGDVLRRMTRTFNFSEPHFKLLVHHIRKLNDKTPTLAVTAIDELLKTRILQSGREDWIERLIIIRIWMTTNHFNTPETVEDISSLLTSIQGDLPKPIGSSATTAAQTLIWKKIEANYSQGLFNVAEGWCRVALHNVFQNAGPLNQGKIGRKLLLCALGTNDSEKATTIFHELPELTQNEPVTRYLMFKVALRTSDSQLAVECLEFVGRAAAKEPEFLYACVLDAQQAGDKFCAVAAMKELVGRYQFETNNTIHLPGLLRCTIRLLYSVIGSEEEKNADQGPAVKDLCNIFESVVSAVQRNPKDKDGDRVFTVKELEWFCQNAYNLGLKNLQVWDLRHSVRIFSTCLTIIKHFPEDLPVEAASDLSLKAMFCNFVIAAALVSLARTSDSVEQHLQEYLVLRRHVAAFDEGLQSRLPDLDERLSNDLKAKLATLLVFDFEAAVRLKNYSDLHEIILKAHGCADVKAFKAMADCLLGGQLPADELFTAMQLVINEIWEIEQFASPRLFRYIRCLFQVVLPLNNGLALQLTDQATKVARESEKGEHPVPTEELHWLATSAWNHAVELYGVKQDEECRKWADAAMNLAHYAGDDGSLRDEVQRAYLKLKWDP